MPEDPTSQYVWWASMKDLGLRRLARLMMPEDLTPRQKRRIFWAFAFILLVELPLVIYLMNKLLRMAG